MNDLSERLRAAVPEAPDLHDLATRAKAQGRRRRTVSRSLGAAAVAAVVAAAIVVPTALRGGDSKPAPAPTPGEVPQCVDQSDVDTDDLLSGTATWVRFCARDDGQTGIARFPEGAVTGELAARMVANFGEVLDDDSECLGETNRSYRIQVGFEDGTVAQRDDSTGTCGGELLYMRLESAIVSELMQRYTSADTGPPGACPERFSHGLAAADSADGASAELLVGSDRIPALSTRPILALHARAMLVCRYLGSGDRTLDDHWTSANPAADSVRVSALLDYTDGVADCAYDDTRPSYLVVLEDKTGTARSFTIDGAECNAMSAAIGTPPEEQYLGLAHSELVDEIESSRLLPP